jgi:phosphohistidine phosphatase SixA
LLLLLETNQMTVFLMRHADYKSSDHSVMPTQLTKIESLCAKITKLCPDSKFILCCSDLIRGMATAVEMAKYLPPETTVKVNYDLCCDAKKITEFYQWASKQSGDNLHIIGIGHQPDLEKFVPNMRWDNLTIWSKEFGEIDY